LEFVVIFLVGLAAGTLSGIIGTGSSMILMPVLVIFFGPQKAVPIMAIAAVMGNLGRVLAWWREIDWRACCAYSCTAIPGAALGVRTLLAVPPRVMEVALGLFFIGMVPIRRWLRNRSLRFSTVHLVFLGGCVGFLTGIVVSTGPLTVPIFLGYGLDRGSFLSTEAAASLAVYVAKVVTFRASTALPWGLAVKGLATGVALMAGAFIAKRVVLRMSTRTFFKLIDGLMLSSGLSLLWVAAH
jgi:uncharacterized membrane protein YfcA